MDCDSIISKSFREEIKAELKSCISECFYETLEELFNVKQATNKKDILNLYVAELPIYDKEVAFRTVTSIVSANNGFGIYDMRLCDFIQCLKKYDENDIVNALIKYRSIGKGRALIVKSIIENLGIEYINILKI